MRGRPTVICHMTGSVDGRLHPSRYTESPDGTVSDWSALYEAVHDRLDAGGWLVGRATMAEMAKGAPHPPSGAQAVERPIHRARRDARTYAFAPDTRGTLHFAKADVGGDHVVVLLGSEVPDAHLAELAGDGVSYVVGDTPEIDLAAMLDIIGGEFGVSRLLVEGGGTINGALLAAGLVDELSVIVAPAIDGGTARDGIVAFGEDGLKGRVTLSLAACDRLDHGAVHLRYRVAAA